MKRIPLTQGQFALVDDEDYDRLNQFKWHAVKAHRSYYAVRTIKDIDGKCKHIKMHREILGLVPNDGVFVDHINCVTLDNRSPR